MKFSLLLFVFPLYIIYPHLTRKTVFFLKRRNLEIQNPFSPVHAQEVSGDERKAIFFILDFYMPEM